MEPFERQLRAEVSKLGIPGIVWTQYTPYYNDGSECVFGVNEPNVIVGDPDNVTDMYDEYNTLELYGDFKHISKYYGERLKSANIDAAKYTEIKKLTSWFCSSAAEDLLREMYGDHKMIKVTPDRVVVDEYEHD